MGILDFLKSNSDQPTVSQVLALDEQIKSTSSLSSLKQLYNAKGNVYHPQVSYAFGIGFLLLGDEVSSQRALIQGASFGIKHPSPYYDNLFFSDSVGQCLMTLVTQFTLNQSAKVDSVTALAYIFLSKCIELNGIKAHDSFRSRAVLFIDHEAPNMLDYFLMDQVGMGFLKDPLIISDFYYASQSPGSPFRDAIQAAQSYHRNLEDISIGGKDADDYSLVEMARLGQTRHHKLFKILEAKYQLGEFDLTENDLISILV